MYMDATRTPTRARTTRAIRLPGSRNDGRAYSGPVYGRFLQTDPIGYDDQTNLYAYAENDPVNRRDPSGEFSLARLRPGTIWAGVRILFGGGSRSPAAEQRQASQQRSNRQVGATVVGAVGQSQTAIARQGVRMGVPRSSAGIRAISGYGTAANLASAGLTYSALREEGRTPHDAATNTAGQATMNILVAGVGVYGGSLFGVPGEVVGGIGLPVLTDALGITSAAGDAAEQMLRPIPEEDCSKCQVSEIDE